MSVAEAAAAATRTVAASESHAEENAHINSVQERNCHPERSGCFALRSSRAVEGPLPAEETFAVEAALSGQLLRQDRDPSTPSAHSQCEWADYAQDDTESFRRTEDYARSFPPRDSSALMNCADHCATSSSRRCAQLTGSGPAATANTCPREHCLRGKFQPE